MFNFKRKLEMVGSIINEYIRPSLGKSTLILVMAATSSVILVLSINNVQGLLSPTISHEEIIDNSTNSEIKYVLTEENNNINTDDSRVKYISDTQKSNQLEDIIDSLNDLTEE